MFTSIEKIGIYAGTFDPVHIGHINFAIQAQKQYGLSKVVFLPEVKPRYKPNVTDIKHRVTMLKMAIKPYPTLGLIKLSNKQFSFKSTVPQLQKMLGKSQLVYLFGSDVFVQILSWPDVTEFAKSGEFIVSIRSADEIEKIITIGAKLGCKTTIIKSQNPEVSSLIIRSAIKLKQRNTNLINNILDYIKLNHLYDT